MANKTVVPRRVAQLLGLMLALTPGAGYAQTASTAKLEPHPGVSGGKIDSVELSGPTGTRVIEWDALGGLSLVAGDYTLRATAAGGEGLHVEVPPCAGRTGVRINGARVGQGAGPIVFPLPPRPAQAHSIEISVRVSSYERRIACGHAPRYGARAETREGLGTLTFASPQATRGGGQAVVFVPPRHDFTKPAALLVGAHPWNGSPWTYPAYAELLDEAAKRDVVLLFPSGLGNSLYTADAEEEVVRAMDSMAQVLAVDPNRVSIWGASMGGAGATTIAFHRPDRFAAVISLFGDSKYDLATYVKSILTDEAAARRVNALDVVDNARHLDVWLVHGEADRISPIAQSTMLESALRERGFAVRLDRVPKAGHDGALVARNARAIVEKAASAKRPASPTRVTYRSVRPTDLGAYGVRFVRNGREDALVDVERDGDRVIVRRAVHVRSIELARGALGLAKAGRIERAEGVPSGLEVRFEDAP